MPEHDDLAPPGRRGAPVATTQSPGSTAGAIEPLVIRSGCTPAPRATMPVAVPT